MTRNASFIANDSPALVLSEPNHLYLRVLSEGLGSATAERLLREADGIEAACQARPWALRDPDPLGEWVERFHRSCDRRGVRLVRTLHAMDRVNPVARRNGVCLADPSALEDNVRLVRAEASLAAALRRPAGGEALLVIHPGPLYRDDWTETVRIAAEVLRRCAEHAAARRVRLSVETEPVSERCLCLGSDIRALAGLVGEVNGWCEARGIEPVAAITMDLEHSLIAAWGDEERVLAEIERYGSLIEYIHVVRPLDIFDAQPPPTPRPWTMRDGWMCRKADFFLRRLFNGRSANAHQTIAPPGGDARMERLIRAACEKTAWRRTGVFNFEVLPRWYYLPRCLRRGATAQAQLAGLRRLRELVNGGPPPATG